MTTDDKRTDPTPALLPPARLDRIREDADDCREALTDGQIHNHTGDEAITDALHRLIAEHVPALLRHLDALTPREVDGEALGRLLAGIMADHLGVKSDPLGYNAGALALYRRGIAAAREEAVEDRRDLRATIARLTAELTEARATGERWKVACERQEQANASADREDDKRVAAARLDGAREERALCLADCKTERVGGHLVGPDIERKIEARPLLVSRGRCGEGRATEGRRESPPPRGALSVYQQKRADDGHCMSNSDGECDWSGCPQEKDNRAHYKSVCPRWAAKHSDDEGRQG